MVGDRTHRHSCVAIPVLLVAATALVLPREGFSSVVRAGTWTACPHMPFGPRLAMHLAQSPRRGNRAPALGGEMRAHRRGYAAGAVSLEGNLDGRGWEAGGDAQNALDEVRFLFCFFRREITTDSTGGGMHPCHDKSVHSVGKWWWSVYTCVCAHAHTHRDIKC
jgi:hypothetical protein